MPTLFSDFLGALGVRHTVAYSDARFRAMPFATLFGLSKLLGEYGVTATGLRASDKGALRSLTVPFLADTADGFAIVTAITPDKVTYLTQGRTETTDLASFAEAWNGIVLVAQPTASAGEPGYREHRAIEVMDRVKVVGLWVLAAVLVGFLMVHSGLWRSWSALALLVLDAAGVWVSWMLVEKSLGIKNQRADAVCSALEPGGCDRIARSEASSFLGIVKWSEVGLAYFSVSLAALLVFPEASAPWLALCNACALPYTVWSITYQKFVAKTWCTLCVTVQALLWGLFIVYTVGGWWHGAFPLGWPLAVLVGCYAIALLAINTFDRALARLLPDDDNPSNTPDYGTDSIHR